MRKSNTLDFTNWLIVVLLGATAADSKANFIKWVDDMVTSVATDRCKVYLLSGVRDHGNFANLSNEEFTTILAKFSKPKTWITEILHNQYTCGGFLIMTGGGAGRMSQQGMFLGPFQS